MDAAALMGGPSRGAHGAGDHDSGAGSGSSAGDAPWAGTDDDDAQLLPGDGDDGVLDEADLDGHASPAGGKGAGPGGGDPDAPATAGECARLVATIVKSFIGSGVLFLPKAFANGGWLFSVVMMVVAAVLTQVTIMRLVLCRDVVRGSYGMIGRRAVGRWGELAVDVSLVLSQAGFGMVYIIFIARNVLQLVNALSASCWLGSGWLWALILAEFAVFWPLSLTRRIASFGLTNIAADVLIVGGLVGVLAFSVAGMATDAGRGVAVALPALNTAGWPLMLGTAVYAYEGIGMVLPVVDSLRPGMQRAFGRVMMWTLVGVAGVYIVVGMVPYVYLVGMARVPMQDAVTLNLPRAWWSFAIMGAYCIALAFSYPYMLFPAIRIIEKGLARGGLLGADADGFVVRRNAVRALVVATTLGIALVGAQQLNNFVSLIGALACTPLAFIYPCWFHLRLHPRASLWMRASNVAIIVLGALVTVWSTWQAIATWSVSPINACVDS